MRIWLIKLEEPVPTDDDFRPYRMSMIADGLLSRGHDVVRWCSDFDHLKKKPRYNKNFQIFVNSNYKLNFLHSAVTYNKPVSFSRFINNIQVRLNFKKMALNEKKPDVIICSMPTPEMAKECAKLSKLFNVPLIIDARDMWPDVISNELTGLKSFLAKPVIYNMRNNLSFACKQATSCVGITDFFVDFLMGYACRKRGELDCSFPLGYKITENIISIENAKNFWMKQGISFDGDNKYIYFAGRLNSTVANVFDKVISAAKILKTQQPSIRFIICGSGQSSEQIKEQSQGINNIIFPGEVPSEYLNFLRVNSDIALQPIERRTDYQNSLSNKFFEYVSSGLPILTYLDGLTENVINEHQCGFKFSTGNELASQIECLITDHLLYKTFSKNSLILFKKHFEATLIYEDFAVHVENVLKAYNVEA